MKGKLKNSFGISEWSGAMGDLGTMLPLAFALVVFNGYPPERIFSLWGITYFISGYFYKVPVSVQPLKAMSVIAIAHGFSLNFLTSTAVIYGLLLIILSATGILKWLQKWFSPALVKGIQLGIGLILAQKALKLVIDNGLMLHFKSYSIAVNTALMLAVILILWLFQFRKKFPAVLMLIGGSILLVAVFLPGFKPDVPAGSPFELSVPDFSIWLDALVLLIIPQLPLTLGNAIFAADDSCHTLWKDQAERVNPTRLGLSIGISDALIGTLGGFPICHGAGGMGAHAQFGGKTGGTTMILGGILIIVGLISPLAAFLFLIPIPILGSLLLFDSIRMITFVRKLGAYPEIVTAAIVGLVSFFTSNLSIALAAGLAAERGFAYLKKKIKIKTAEEKA